MPDLITVWKTISRNEKRKYNCFSRDGEELTKEAVDPSARAEMAACLSKNILLTIAKVQSK